MSRRCFIVIFGMALLSLRVVSADRAQPKEAAGIFEFHSGFWINLHHFLYEQALSGKPGSVCGEGNGESSPDWASSVLFYKQAMVSRDLLFDDGMVKIKNSLEDNEGSKSLISDAELPAPLIAALQRPLRPIAAIVGSGRTKGTLFGKRKFRA